MVVEISRDAEREAVFAVAGADVARATPGMPVKVWLQAQPEVAVTGSVREISPVADSTTGHLRGEGRAALGAAGDAPRRHRRRPRRSRGPGSHDAARHRAPAIRRRRAGLGRVQGQPGAPPRGRASRVRHGLGCRRRRPCPRRDGGDRRRQLAGRRPGREARDGGSSDDPLQPFRMGREQPGHRRLLHARLPHRRAERLPAAGPRRGPRLLDPDHGRPGLLAGRERGRHPARS